MGLKLKKGGYSMEIMKIGHNSIKINLCAKEAREYNLTEESELCTDEMRGVFAKLLSRAKKEVGFEYTSKRVVAEVFSSKDGGCEIFVSQAGVENEMYKDKSAPSEIRRVKTNTGVFSFDSLEKLLSATARLKKMSYSGKSSIYYDEFLEKYYIILEDVSIKDIKYAFLSEYSKQMKSNFNLYLKEHCKCLVKKDAVNCFSRLK